MAKEKALITQLEEANIKIAELENKLESEQRSYRYALEARDKYSRELEAVHSALDCIPNNPPRIVNPANSYGSIEVTVSARLFAWIATIAFKGTKTTTKIEEEE